MAEETVAVPTDRDRRPTVWVFTASVRNRLPEAFLPVAVFDGLASGLGWAARAKSSGMLTEYPLDVSVYDWAVAKGHFRPRREDQRATPFMETFSDASQEHCHLTRGKTLDGCEQTGAPVSVPFAWVFNGKGRWGCFPSGAFSDPRPAREWIGRIGASGVLTRLRVNEPPPGTGRTTEEYRAGERLGTTERADV